MPLFFFDTMGQKSQKWPKTQINGGGSFLKDTTIADGKVAYLDRQIETRDR